MGKYVTVVGGGLAGCECAYACAERGVNVHLYEMRPEKMTPAHESGCLGELVCSSSLKSTAIETAHGLLKDEMAKLGSIVIDCAKKTSVPGGSALCVDREKFGRLLTEVIEGHENIEVVRGHCGEIPEDRPCVVATGPLTSDEMALDIARLTGAGSLHFFDAIAPSVESDSIDSEKVFRQARYDKGEADYINCPMEKEEYEAFIDALVSAEIANLHLEEEKRPEYFEGCLPVEVIAKRGRETLAHGTMKPVGLTDPKTGKRPYVVVQLRQENEEASVHGLVGFQTQLKQSEQKRVFRMIPGLENAEFVRFGAVHRNTYIESPNVLYDTLEAKGHGGLFFAGQLTGVEGYMESAATGIIAGINAARHFAGKPLVVVPEATLTGALIKYVSSVPDRDYVPMNSQMGLLPEPHIRRPKSEKKRLRIENARAAMDQFLVALQD